MSTATAIYHAAGPHARSEAPASYPVCFVVLDSPYTSVQDMARECFARLSRLGYYVPEAIFSLGVSLVRSSLQAKLDGMDPFDVRPIECAEHCTVPCCVLISVCDDYVPVEHGLAVVQQWLGPACSRQFLGAHFARREPELLAWVAQRIPASLSPASSGWEDAPEERTASTWRDIRTPSGGGGSGGSEVDLFSRGLVDETTQALPPAPPGPREI